MTNESAHIDQSLWLMSSDVPSTVRYLARVLSEAEADEFRSIASHNSEARQLLVSVQRELKEIQALPLADLALVRGEDSLRGQVSDAWLEISSMSLTQLASIELANAKISLVAAARTFAGGIKGTPIVRIILSPRPRLAVQPAFARGESDQADFKVNASVDADGSLIVDAEANPEKAAALEGQTIEVSMRVDLPLVVGSGEVSGGRFQLRVPDVGKLLGVPAGPLPGSDLEITYGTGAPKPNPIYPLDGNEHLFDYPFLVSPLLWGSGILKATIQLPHPMATALAGRMVTILGMFAPEQWQTLFSFQIKKGILEYSLETNLGSLTDLEEELLLPLRFSVAK